MIGLCAAHQLAAVGFGDTDQALADLAISTDRLAKLGDHLRREGGNDFRHSFELEWLQAQLSSWQTQAPGDAQILTTRRPSLRVTRGTAWPHKPESAGRWPCRGTC